MADEKLQIDITAKDDASKVIDPLVKKVDQLEKADPTVNVDADTHSAVNDVDTFAKKLAKLSDSDQVVLLALRAGAAQSELADIATKLATIDASDPTVDVQLERYQQVSGQLDDLKKKITDIGETPIDPGTGDGGKNLDNAKNKLHEVGAEAGKTKDAVHSMAGNAIGDFAQTASGIGPLGEALGQLTELASGGEASMKELATAGLGLGAISGGMFALNAIMGEFAKTAAHAAEIKAFRTADVDAFTASLRAGKDATQELIDKVEQTGKLAGVFAGITAGSLGQIGPQIKTDLIGPLADAGVTVQQFAGVVTGSQSDIDRFAAALDAAGVSADLQRVILGSLKTAHEDYATAVEQSTKFTKAFTPTLDDLAAGLGNNDGSLTKLAKTFADTIPTLADLNAGLGDNDGSLTKLAASTRKASADFKGLNDQLRTANSGTNALTLAYQGLSGTVDQDQSMINLKNQIADVQTAAENAYAAQVEADKATSKHAKDAADKQAAAAQATRDYQTQINNLKTDIINLGQTAGENPVQVQADIDKINNNDLAGVEADAEAYFRAHPIDAATRLKLISTVVAGVGQPVSTSQHAAAAPTTIVNNNYGPTPSLPSLAAAAAPARWARINGR